MNVVLFLSYKLFFSGYSRKNISSLVYISFLSIFFSSFILILISSIMDGFENETYKALKGFNPDIIIKSYDGSYIDFDKLSKILSDEFQDDIKIFYPESFKRTILSVNKNNRRYYIPLLIKALNIDYVKFNDINYFNRDNFDNQDTILIGKSLSEIYHLKNGDAIELIYLEDDDSVDLDFNNYKLNVNGIFKTSLYDFDESIAFISLNTFNKVFNEEQGCGQVNIILNNQYKAEDIIQKLKLRLNLNVFSWQSQYPTIISSLKFEKYVMIIILLLVSLMAAFNVVLIIFIYISYNEKNIALLKSIGYSNRYIIYIFTLIGLFISIPAIILGALIALFLAFIIDHFHLIYLPDVYYINYLPANIDIYLISILLFFLIIISFIASFYGSYKTRYIDTEKLLR
jgi:lipoprotein-releasing system permease protein